MNQKDTDKVLKYLAEDPVIRVRSCTCSPLSSQLLFPFELGGTMGEMRQ